MKRLKYLSVLIALIMLAGVFAPVFAANEEDHKTIIRIHKIVMPKDAMDKHTDEGKDPKYNGSQIADIGKYFGGNSKEVAGIEFDIYREVDLTLETGALDHDNPILGTKG